MDARLQQADRTETGAVVHPTRRRMAAGRRAASLPGCLGARSRQPGRPLTLLWKLKWRDPVLDQTLTLILNNFSIKFICSHCFPSFNLELIVKKSPAYSGRVCSMTHLPLSLGPPSSLPPLARVKIESE